MNDAIADDAIADDAERLRPTRLRVETTTRCQLACPTCPTAEGRTFPALGRGFLRAKDFSRLLDQGGGRLRAVELSNYGEPFLNPQLLDIFRIAAERGVALTLDNGANLNHARPDVLEGLTKYGVRALRCSIDGVTQEVYGAYRRRGDLAAVLANVKKINEFKAAYGSPYPRLIWQFVVFAHNRHQYAQAYDAARILGMAFSPKLSWSDKLAPADASKELLQALGGAATRAAYGLDAGKIYLGEICEQLWTQPQINFDGRMLGCCQNYWGEFGGDAFENLEGAINSPLLRYARDMLRGKAPPRDDVPCVSCAIFAERRRRGLWLEAAPEE